MSRKVCWGLQLAIIDGMNFSYRVQHQAFIMSIVRVSSLIAFLIVPSIVYAEADQSDSAYDWSYSSSVLLAANNVVAPYSFAAQEGTGGSGNSSGDNTSEDSDSRETDQFATRGSREHGEHVLDETGNKKIWPHKLPFLGQKVISLGYDLPDPYGVSLIGSFTDQALQIDNLRVSTSGTVDGPYVSVNDFVTFAPSEAAAYAAEAKFDFWLWPFLNVFFILGHTDGTGNIPLSVGVEGALDFLGRGAICPDNPPIPALRPGFCDDSMSLDAQPDYYGTNYGMGIVLAGGWKGFYLAAPISYTYSDMSNLKHTIGALNAELLLGYTIKSKHPDRSLDIFIGGNYLDTATDIQNSIILPFSQIDPSLSDQEIFYEIDEGNTDKWNYVAGGNFQISKKWSIQAQVGFGGSREQYLLDGTYRW